ncbi:MAG: hypothetical protein IPG50_35065 [Myxococcales bacterium]|nr:hypothetical protein [Myxococcales bacterium]
MRLSGALTLLSIGLLAGASLASCSSDPPRPTLTGEALLDPNTCASCHPDHFREWSGSMHAYAAEDPVFLAMNRRMQRESNGALGDFCVKCHAPMAVRLGKTRDGLNLADLPQKLRGVTCYFCHSVAAVTGSHDAALTLDDAQFGGAIADPIKGTPHGARASAFHDRERAESSSLCGACHDVITPHGAHIERTFLEWTQSLYAKPSPKTQLTCGKCHMESRLGKAAAVADAPTRRLHDHSMPAVDVALTPFPEADDQRRRVQQFLDGSLIAKLCVRRSEEGFVADVSLDNAFAGHAFPSGAAQDRRVWVELVATRGDAVVYSSGVVRDGEAAAKLADPNLWLLRDKIFDAAGREVHMFWEAARVEPQQLPAAVTSDPSDPAFFHAVTRSYLIGGAAPDRIKMRVRMRPIDFDVLDDLVQSGDLERAVVERVPTFDLAGAVKEWRDGEGPCGK